MLGASGSVGRRAEPGHHHLAVVRHADGVSLLQLALRIQLLPLVKSVGDDETTPPEAPGVLERRLGGELFRSRVEGGVGELVILGPMRDQAPFIILGTRWPLTDRIATSIGIVGGLL